MRTDSGVVLPLTPSVLINRNFGLLWSGNAISLIGCYCVSVGYPLIVLTVTGSSIKAGWVATSFALPALLLQLPAGKIADSFDRRYILITCQTIGLFAVLAALLVAVLQPPGTVLLWCFTAFVEGSALVLFQICEVPVVRDVVHRQHRTAAFSFFEAEQPIAIIVGRTSGAITAGVARWLPFLVNAVSYLLCVATLCLMTRPDPSELRAISDGSESGPVRMRDGVRTVWGHPFLRITTLIAGLSSMTAQVAILLILVQMRSSGGGAWAVGVVLGANGVGGVLGSILAPYLLRLFPLTVIYRGALWSWAVCLCSFVFTFDPRVVLACWGGVGCAGAIIGVLLTLVRTHVVPDAVLGRSIAAMATWNAGAASLGPLAGGCLISWYGVEQTRIVIPAAMCCIAFISIHPSAVQELDHSRDWSPACFKDESA